MNKSIKSIALFWLIPASFFCRAQPVKEYKSLDSKNPIVFAGSYIVYENDTVTLGPKAFFIDGQFSKDVAARYPFVFSSVNEAATQLTDGTEALPMTLYIAPYVYWIDDPDDPAIRVGEGGAPPYGLIIKCEWLQFKGLSANAANVVLASNRGQTIGAKGNFTMFKFIGEGTGSENITFGNYCNVDLEYRLLPKLSRKKRASAIVQAQLIHCDGDKILARNTRFISRLNLCPFVGGKRVLFDGCHFESTDDALCGTGVYLNCTLDVYGSKPFYRTTGTGAVFLNSDIQSFTRDEQFFTKANGQVAVIDTRIKTNPGTYIGWRDVVPPETKNYQYNVTQNGKPLLISKKNSASTVDLSNDPALHAYRFKYNGKTVYNTYNLLMGNDDWDPMQVKPLVLAAQKLNNADYTKIPVQLLISPTGVSIETNKHDVRLKAKLMRFGDYESPIEKLRWTVTPEYQSLVKLNVSDDGTTCTVIPTNNTYDDAKEVIVTASTSSGLEAASSITVKPPILPAPAFETRPSIALGKNGKVHLAYKLDTRFKDESVVNWYRCSNAACTDAIEVAVSRFDVPLVEYNLLGGDVGYYIMASIAPKHIRSSAGETVKVNLPKPIVASDLTAPANTFFTDFKNVSTKNQPEVIPGFWTMDHLEVATNEQRFRTDKTKDAWFYGEGSDGAAGMTGLLQGRSADLRFTPVGGHFGDMSLTMNVAPFKTAGQGFSVAPLYMDVLIKFDPKTMTGYALRLVRTTKHGDAVDCMWMKYDNGKVSPISDSVTTTAFRTVCTITLKASGNKLTANITTTAGEHSAAGKPGIVPEVNLTTTVVPNTSGGFGMQYNGGSPTLIKDLKITWEKR